MNDKQKGLFNKNTESPKQDSPSMTQSPIQQEKRPLISINLDGKGILILGFIVWMLLESFAPDPMKPSIYLARRGANFENEKLDKTKEGKAIFDATTAKAVGQVQIEIDRKRTYEVGRVQNALEEAKTQLVQTIQTQIRNHQDCVNDRRQRADTTRLQCNTDGQSSYTDCEIAQYEINAEDCPEMPVISAQTQQILDQYQPQQ